MTFFIVASLILLGMQAVIGLWFYFLFPALGWKIPAVALPVLLTALTRWAMTYTRTHYGTLESVLYYFSYTWAGLVFIAFFIVLGCALVQWILYFFHINARAALTYVSLGLLLFVSAAAIYGGLSQPKIKHIDVVIEGAPEMTLAVISDSHLGEGVPLPRFEKALRRLAQAKPDALLVLGDFFEYGMHRRKYARAAADFKTPLGAYGVFGNHEYYMGYGNSAAFYDAAGVKRLHNQIHTLPNGVQLIGVNDIKTARITPAQLDKLLSQSDPAKPRILLSHQPLLTEVAAKHNIALMLSGHTHNGQIFPFNFFVKLKYPYVYGMYKLGPKSNIYVTSGMFYWGIPLRFLAPAEIPVLHIKGHD